MWAVSDRIIFVKWNGKQAETSNFVDKYIFASWERSGREERAVGSEIEYYHFHLFPFIVSKKRKTFVIVFKPSLVRARNGELPSRLRIVLFTVPSCVVECELSLIRCENCESKKLLESLLEISEMFDLSCLFILRVHDYTSKSIFFL